MERGRHESDSVKQSLLKNAYIHMWRAWRLNYRPFYKDVLLPSPITRRRTLALFDLVKVKSQRASRIAWIGFVNELSGLTTSQSSLVPQCPLHSSTPKQKQRKVEAEAISHTDIKRQARNAPPQKWTNERGVFLVKFPVWVATAHHPEKKERRETARERRPLK